MRVLIAPDSFTGSMTAAQAASSVAEGWLARAPGDTCVQLPLSDGGPGFVDALVAGSGGQLVDVATTGPWGAPVEGRVLIASEGAGAVRAYIESAQATGASGVSAGDPTAATSAGVADLVLAALRAGATAITIGLGGSLTTDAGAGLLAGLGATALDREGHDATALLTAGGGGLHRIASVDLAPARRRLLGVDLVIAADVDVPLLGPRGAARGFGPQKGADEHQVARLESSLTAFAHACGRLPDGRSPAVALGAGAAGGLGFALLHLGGRVVPGIDAVLAAVGFEEQVAAADLVITGEGRFDWQSLRGKVVLGVCRAAMAHAKPVLVLAGEVEVGRREWMAIGVSGAYGIIDVARPDGSPDRAVAVAEGPRLLAALASRAAATWSR